MYSQSDLHVVANLAVESHPEVVAANLKSLITEGKKNLAGAVQNPANHADEKRKIAK